MNIGTQTVTREVIISSTEVLTAHKHINLWLTEIETVNGEVVLRRDKGVISLNCGDFARAEEYGVLDIANAVWTPQVLAEWEQTKLDAAAYQASLQQTS